jgi:tRNA C32,U32 (ribose-2'-O)-methylase TrmJ
MTTRANSGSIARNANQLGVNELNLVASSGTSRALKIGIKNSCHKL